MKRIDKDVPVGVMFKIPRSFKIAVDVELSKRQINLRVACIRGLAQFLSIPEPKEQSHA